MIAKAERVLTTVAAMLVFTLNELHLFNARPRAAGEGFMHAVWIRTFGAPEQVFLSTFDVAARWSLVGLTVLLALWAVMETLERPKTPQRQRID